MEKIKKDYYALQEVYKVIDGISADNVKITCRNESKPQLHDKADITLYMGMKQQSGIKFEKLKSHSELFKSLGYQTSYTIDDCDFIYEDYSDFQRKSYRLTLEIEESKTIILTFGSSL